MLNKYTYFVGIILNIAFFVYTFIPDKTWAIHLKKKKKNLVKLSVKVLKIYVLKPRSFV